MLMLWNVSTVARACGALLKITRHGAAPDHPSQGRRLPKNPLADAGAQTPLGDDVHLSLEHCLQVDRQAAEVKQAAVGFHVHQKINVATGIVLGARFPSGCLRRG